MYLNTWDEIFRGTTQVPIVYIYRLKNLRQIKTTDSHFA